MIERYYKAYEWVLKAKGWHKVTPAQKRILEDINAASNVVFILFHKNSAKVIWINKKVLLHLQQRNKDEK